MSTSVGFGKVDPERAGFAPERLANVTSITNEGAEEELYPGAVLWVGRRGVDAFLHSVGHTDFERGTQVDERTLFDLASLTKPIATATATLLLCQDGKVHLGQCVTDFLPGQDSRHLSEVTIRHLLTHTSGLPAWKDLYSDGQARDQVIEQLLAIPLENDPGTHYTYSCLGYILLGVIVEKLCETGLDCFARDRIFEPLGMISTTFNPQPGEGTTIACTAHCPLRKRQLIGEVHDGNAYAMGGVSGNAGLFSNVVDLAAFCRAVTFEPLKGTPFGSSMINLMLMNAIPEAVGGQTIGWFTYPNDMLPGGDLVSRGAIGHSGFTGTSVMIDPLYELAVVFLTNRVCRSDDGARFRDLRRRVFNGVFGSIVR